MAVDPQSGETLPVDATSPFPNPGETATDFDAQSATRVALQYKNSPNLLATISANNNPFQQLEDCAVTIPALDDPTVTDNPTSTTNVNLDVIGEIVGQSRVLANGTVLTNAKYLQLIALRIARNSSTGTSPEFLDYLTFVFQTYVGGSAPFRFYDIGGMAVGVEIGAAPSGDQIALLNDGPSPLSPAPRAMGVSVGREWFDESTWFAFAEDTGSGAKGFGLESDPTVGGQLAMLF
jgi:hypothetical protein